MTRHGGGEDVEGQPSRVAWTGQQGTMHHAAGIRRGFMATGRYRARPTGNNSSQARRSASWQHKCCVIGGFLGEVVTGSKDVVIFQCI